MSMTICQECGKIISSEDEKCIYCGFSVVIKKQLTSPNQLDYTLLMIIITAVVVGIVYFYD